jgi:hypothetical protein
VKKWAVEEALLSGTEASAGDRLRVYLGPAVGDSVVPVSEWQWVAIVFSPSSVQEKIFVWHWRAQLLVPTAETKQPSALRGYNEGPTRVSLYEST